MKRAKVGKKCKDKDTIDEWLLKHPAFFIHETQRIQRNQFEYDEKRGFPLVKGIGSISYGPIIVDPRIRDNMVKIDELMAHKQTLTINDDPIGFESSKRSVTFLNIENVRHLIESKDNLKMADKSELKNLIKVFSIQLSKDIHETDRAVKTLATVAAEVGGTATALFAVLKFLASFVGGPLRDI